MCGAHLILPQENGICVGLCLCVSESSVNMSPGVLWQTTAIILHSFGGHPIAVTYLSCKYLPIPHLQIWSPESIFVKLINNSMRQGVSTRWPQSFLLGLKFYDFYLSQPLPIDFSNSYECLCEYTKVASLVINGVLIFFLHYVGDLRPGVK